MLLPMYGDGCHARVCPGGLKLKQEKRVSFLLSEPEQERTHTRSEQVLLALFSRHRHLLG